MSSVLCLDPCLYVFIIMDIPLITLPTSLLTSAMDNDYEYWIHLIKKSTEFMHLHPSSSHSMLQFLTIPIKQPEEIKFWSNSLT